VLVCELAGNYDLLVPLMLTQGIAFVALRSRALYTSQVPTIRDSPVHRDALLLDVLRGMRVRELMRMGIVPVCFRKQTSADEIMQRVGDNPDQDVFPVLDDAEQVVGLVTTATLRVMSIEFANTRWTLAADLMQPVVSVRADDDLRTATERMVANGLRELPILDHAGHVIGLLDESELAEVYLKAAFRAESADRVAPPSRRA
jgi:chloride channel protein, CIC family